MNPFVIFILAFLIGAVMALSHIFPWKWIAPLIVKYKRWDDEKKDLVEVIELKRIPSYVIGSTIILFGFLGWCILTNDYAPFIILAIMDFAGFLGALIPRAVKRIDKAIEDARKKAEELEVYKKADNLARRPDEKRDRTPGAD